MIQKRILVPQRLRRPPATGWSWLDRRFLREHGDYLSREALLLYLFLAAVADRHGLSFYSDNALACRLRLSREVLQQARQELLDRDLIAQQLPLVQVRIEQAGARRGLGRWRLLPIQGGGHGVPRAVQSPRDQAAGEFFDLGQAADLGPQGDVHGAFLLGGEAGAAVA